MRNPYVDLCLHVQALRRRAEEVRTPLASAVGVAASIYTHQVANVLRVLTDVRVRHLLADEVGLGKTVQALMILNALRRQRRDLRALVVVPDGLVTQWRDELMARAHTAPYETNLPDEGQYVRLAWEDQLRQRGTSEAPTFALADIDATRYQVLIVDELHRLRADVQDRIVRVSAEFEHVLVLTATPSFQRPERHAQLFALLEPERAAIARWEVADDAPGLTIGDDLSKWPEWAAQRVVDALLARDQAAASAAVDEGSLTATAMALCAYRRVIRTRRIDYSGVLPRRQHCPVVVEPLGAEVDRQALMWRYFAHLGELSTQFDPVLLAKRVILSPPSLEQRVDFFRRKGHERDGLLERVKPLVHKNRGDSRADALVDLLAAIWTRTPEERVLVAAQDNLTVDYLYALVQARLPEIGPIGARVPLVAARVRQGMETDAVEDLGGFGNETSENLEAFQRGEAQVLLVTEAAQVGLNLQCARVLVLYSVPWKPEEVEQWIGRLDRIGNVAAFSKDGDAQTIDVYTIAQRGLVDEKVVTVLQRFHAFERSVNLDGAHLDEVAHAIEDAALRPDSVSWRALEDRTASMAAEDAVQDLNSALRPHLPWHVRWAIAVRGRLNDLRPIAPVLANRPAHASAGPKAWDRAVEPMFKLLEKAGDYHVWKNTDPETGMEFRTVWYRFDEFGERQTKAKVRFSFGADPTHERSPKHAHAFITRRGDIGTPPLRRVMMTLNGQPAFRELRFANYGNPLHDDLVDGWIQLPPPPQQVLDVTYPDDHELWKYAQPGWFLLRMSVLDPADVLTLEHRLEAVNIAVASVVTRSANEQLPQLVAPFSRTAKCALEVDIRWLRASLTATTAFRARWYASASRVWKDVPEEAIAALMNPMARKGDGLPQAKPLSTNMAAFVAELSGLRSRDPRGGKVWNLERPAFAAELRARLRVVSEEASAALDLVKRQLGRAEGALLDAEERGNRSQITRAEHLRDAAVDIVAMTEIFWQKREAWLCACESAVADLRPREQLVATIHARRASI